MKSKSPVFYLNPDYENFQPGKTPLRLATVMPTGYEIIAIWFISLIFIFGGCCVILIRLWQDDEFLRINGRATTMAVTHCLDNQIGIGRGGFTTELSYTYQVNGIFYTGSQRVPGVCADYIIGQLYTGTYLATNPSQSYIYNQRDLNLPVLERYFVQLTVLGAFGMLWVVTSPLVLIAWIRYQRAKRRYRRLLEHGRVLEGRLINARYFVSNKRHFIQIECEYTIGKNNLRRLKQIQFRNHFYRLLPPPPPGTALKILYADDDAVVVL